MTIESSFQLLHVRVVAIVWQMCQMCAAQIKKHCCILTIPYF